MLVFRKKLTHRRRLVWYVMPICLFLISLGFRIPSVSQKFTSPKPSPRAVIETTGESSKFTWAKHVQPVELCEHSTELAAPAPYRIRYLFPIYRFRSAAAPEISARAPPFLLS